VNGYLLAHSRFGHFVNQLTGTFESSPRNSTNTMRPPGFKDWYIATTTAIVFG